MHDHTKKPGALKGVHINRDRLLGRPQWYQLPCAGQAPQWPHQKGSLVGGDDNITRTGLKAAIDHHQIAAVDAIWLHRLLDVNYVGGRNTIVEPVFGQINEARGSDPFLLQCDL